MLCQQSLAYLVKNHYAYLIYLNFQSFWAGQAASGVMTSALRLMTKRAFENSRNGLRNGASTL
jgi:solute carrier family 29 (equilibrative nucleoside transporter), member 1/2/3